MSAKFNAQLFAQLGGVNWTARDGFFQSEEQMLESVKQSETPDSSATSNSDFAEPVSGSPELEFKSQADVSEMKNPVSQAESEVKPSTKTMVENAIVVIGPDLDEVWENEEAPAWVLWQNIMQAFAWDESQVVFYDLSSLASEESVFRTLEEIIDLGVEWVLAMDAEHDITEQLADGMHVVEVPDLESMLMDPYAKQSFYNSVVALL